MKPGFQRRRSICRSYSVAAALGAGGIAAAALAGWGAGVDILKRPLPGGAAMNPVTALCMLLSGCALAAPARLPRLARACALAVAAIAGLRLAGYLLGWDPGVDRWLFPAALESQPGLPNRMAPNTAACLVLLAAGLLVARRRAWLAQLLALCVAAAALLALLGYAYGARELYAMQAFIPMALNTAAAFLLLSSGLLCAEPECGPMELIASDTDAGRAARRLLPAGVLVPAALGWLHLRAEKAGLYGPEFGVSVMVAATVAILAGLIYWSARLLLGMELEREEAANKKYEELVELSPEAIFIQTGGRFAYVNTALLRLLGLASPGELVGKAVLDFVHSESRELVRARIEQVDKESHGAPVIDARWVRPDGKVVDVEVVAGPFDDQGRAGSQVFLRDVTERKRLERQFLQAQKMEAVGRLAGGVAHDFNNLLTAIGGYCGFLLQSIPPSDPRRADVEEVRKAGQRAAELTRQLLAFSRKQVLRPAVLDLDAAVAGVERMLKRVIGEDIDLVTKPSPGLGRVKADAGQVQQVLMNLVINSRDALPEGGRITIETADVELGADQYSLSQGVKPGPYVMLAVSDTGHGMDAETMSHIFEPFFTTKEQGKGTGLGLSTVYGIVKQSGGNIFASSEPGRGTTIKLYLPRIDEPAEERPERAPVASLRGSETVLLVEDDELVRRFAVRALRENGYAVLEAPSPDEALRLGQEHSGEIHILLTDVVMPAMTGQELARKVRERRPATRVLFMSGYADEAVVRHELLGAGMEFLQKPLTIDSVARKVREVLDAGR